MARTAGQAIVETLADRGVRRFYTVPGESFLEVLDAVEADPRLTLVSCRHEGGAAFMAEAEGKLTGRPAVAMGTRAVGAANLAIGVQTAAEDRTPLLVLLGQVESTSLGRGAFQETDLAAFLGPFSRRGETLHDPARAAEVAARAHWSATLDRGPAVIALPADVLAQPCPDGAPALPPGRVVPVGPGEDDLREIAALLRSARRPVAILGSGAADARDAVIALVERFGLGVYTAFRRQDTFPNSHPHHLGHLTLRTALALLESLAGADVVLALGTRLGDVTSQGYTLPGPDAQVVHVDADLAALTAPVGLAFSVRADVGEFAAGLLRVHPSTVRGRNWSLAHATYLDLSTPRVPPDAGPGVHPAAVMAALARHLPADTIVTTDAGNFSVYGHRYWRFEHPRTALGPVSGAMGYGVPAAIAASLVAPARRVLALVGDGGFLMTGQELETAIRHGASPLVVVFQNGLYGTIAMHQARRFGRAPGSQIGDVDLAGLAAALGAEAVTVHDAADLDDALAGPVSPGRPRVVVVRTDRDELVPGVRLSSLTENG